MKQVRETAAGKSISAWIILNKDGQHIATVQAHYSNGGVVTVDVWDKSTLIHQGKAGGYGYDKFTAAISGAVIDGVRIYNHSVTSDETAAELASFTDALLKGDWDTRNYLIEYIRKMHGMESANWVSKDGKSYPTSMHYIDGLDRLTAMGYKVLKAI